VAKRIKISLNELDLISPSPLPDSKGMSMLWLAFGLLAAWVMLSLMGSERQKRLDERLRDVENPVGTPEKISPTDPGSS
jgi:hypothetical protein